MEPLQPGTYRAVPGEWYQTPKELWGFRARAEREDPRDIAIQFLEANAGLLGLAEIIPRLGPPRVVESLGAHHVIFQQYHDAVRIHRAYVTVHVDRARCVYLLKSRSVPLDRLEDPPGFSLAEAEARGRALAGLPPAKASVLDVEPMWFPSRQRVRPAYRVRVHRERPRQEWITFVDAATGRVLSKWDNLALLDGTARIFDPNPVAAVGDWRLLRADGRRRRPPARAYAVVPLRDLAGTGFLDGRRVSTSKTVSRVSAAEYPGYHFEFKDRGARGFREAMVYYHLDQAIGYLESLGYAGPRAIFQEPLLANASGPQADNSWYSPGLRYLSFGTGGVDDAEDAEVILHEFGHALQDAICRDFGRSGEAAAMGEGFGDYFAASFFAERKPAAYQTSVGTWDGIKDTMHDPPCLRRVDEDLTYESYDHAPEADEHDNGKIWAATLWDIRTALGRRIADTLIIESHFQLDGFTRFAKGARAIIDADTNVSGGEHAAVLRHIFHRRGIGPVE